MNLEGSVIIVTGASQGIGKAIAMTLAQKGAYMCLGSRRPDKLKELYADVIAEEELLIMKLDLADSDSIRDFVHASVEKFQSIDVLIHCGGLYESGRMEKTPDNRISELLSVNVRGSHILFSSVLPYFNSDFGQMVVINSSSAVEAKADIGIFSATTHGIKALTDSFRDENNESGIRVTSLFLGRTATLRMEKIYEQKGIPYKGELLLQPEDVAKTVLDILSLPITAEVTDIYLRPFIKSY